MANRIPQVMAHLQQYSLEVIVHVPTRLRCCRLKHAVLSRFPMCTAPTCTIPTTTTTTPTCTTHRPAQVTTEELFTHLHVLGTRATKTELKSMIQQIDHDGG